MSTFEGKEVTIEKPAGEIYAFISDLTNYEKLLPMDKIDDWQCTTETCSFKIQGTFTIDLFVKEKTPNEVVVLQSGEKAPFPITITAKISDKGSSSTVGFTGEAKINPFLKPMVKGPLQNLFDYMGEHLGKTLAE